MKSGFASAMSVEAADKQMEGSGEERLSPPAIMKAKIYITLKPGVLDPQGKAVQHALASLGFAGVTDARIGKYIELKLDNKKREAAEKDIKQMCEKLLANTVIESYRYEIE